MRKLDLEGKRKARGREGNLYNHTVHSIHSLIEGSHPFITLDLEKSCDVTKKKNIGQKYATLFIVGHLQVFLS